MSLHIFTAPMQPATCWVDHHVDPPITFSGSPYRLVYVSCCRQWRQARYAVVQSYYDGADYWCAPGAGCRHPRTIAANQRRIFRRRSAGQRARWAKRKEIR
jgi:hypothetical protein